MKRFWVGILAVSFLTSGCSVVMALKQPDKKNVQVLTAGASRENVISCLGAPATTEIQDGGRVDIYQFVQGYSGGVKASRAIFHAVADVFSLFIWEIIGTPTELILDGEKKTVKVVYDSSDKIKDVTYLSSKKN